MAGHQAKYKFGVAHLRNSSMRAMETCTSRTSCFFVDTGPPMSAPSGGMTSTSELCEQLSPGAGASMGAGRLCTCTYPAQAFNIVHGQAHPPKTVSTKGCCWDIWSAVRICTDTETNTPHVPEPPSSPEMGILQDFLDMQCIFPWHQALLSA